MPPSVDITSLDLVLGGLLSPGSSPLNGVSATVSCLPVPLTGHAVGPIGSSIELDQAIANALGFGPATAMDTGGSLDDLLSTLTTGLDGDLSALTGLSSDFSALLTDGLGSLFGVQDWRPAPMFAVGFLWLDQGFEPSRRS